MKEARNVQWFEFDGYREKVSHEEWLAVGAAFAAMKLVLLRTLAPRRIAGLGGLIECQGCGAVDATLMQMRHRNCLWAGLIEISKRQQKA